MAASGQKPAKRPGNGKALVLWLYIFAGLDLALSAVIIVSIVSQGWPGPMANTGTPVGLAALAMFAQWILRVPELAISARLTAWMTSRSLVGGAGMSPLWAWLGWFVPVASLWLPCRTIFALNRHAEGRTRHHSLILGWWLTRWLTCPSGVAFLLFALAAILVFAPDRQQSASWLVYLAIPSALSAGLGIAVRRLTFNNQPSDTAMLAATVF